MDDEGEFDGVGWSNVVAALTGVRQVGSFG